MGQDSSPPGASVGRGVPFAVRQLSTLSGHKDSVKSLLFARDSSVLASGDGQTLRLWERDQNWQWRARQVLERRAERLAFSSDGRSLAFSEKSGGAYLYSLETAALTKLLPESQEALCVAFSPGGALLATGDLYGSVLLWERATGDLRLTLRVLPDQEVGTLALPVEELSFSPDGRLLAFSCCSKNRKVQVWELQHAEGGMLACREQWISQITSSKETISDLAFSPRGDVLAVAATLSRAVWLFETRAFRVRGRFEMPEPDDAPIVMSFSPDGFYLAVATDNGRVNIWSMLTHQLLFSFDAHTGIKATETYAVVSIDWSPDATLLATGGGSRFLVPHPKYRLVVGPNDYTIKVWEVLVREEFL